MDDALIVQVARHRGERREPLADEFGRQAVGVAVDDLGERLAEDVLHHDPLVAARVGAEVVEVDEVGVLEVEAVADAAQFGVGVAAEELEGDFLAAVGDGEVDLAEPALADAPLEGVAVERSLAGAVGELHRGHRRSRGVRSFPSVRMIRSRRAEIKEKNDLYRCADIITGWKREDARRLGWAENGVLTLARLHPSHPSREGDRKNQRENTKGAKDAKDAGVCVPLTHSEWRGPFPPTLVIPLVEPPAGDRQYQDDEHQRHAERAGPRRQLQDADRRSFATRPGSASLRLISLLVSLSRSLYRGRSC